MILAKVAILGFLRMLLKFIDMLDFSIPLKVDKLIVDLQICK